MKSVLSTALLVIFVFAGSAAGLLAEEKQSDAKAKEAEAKKTVVIGANAPVFRIKDSEGKEIDLAKLTEKGPVLVRLTCGCSGCDKELAYFQTLHEEYKDKGLTSLAIFREPDSKVEEYVKQKKLNMLYAVDSNGESWKVFQTKTMPTNFLIEKGGKIRSIAAGCDPSGLLANKVSQFVAELLETDKIDVKEKAEVKATEQQKEAAETKQAGDSK